MAFDMQMLENIVNQTIVRGKIKTEGRNEDHTITPDSEREL